MINLVYSIVPVICFIAGLYFGFKIKKTDELPEIKTPAEVIEKKNEEKKAKVIRNETEKYLENIENYPYNQKEID